MRVAIVGGGLAGLAAAAALESCGVRVEIFEAAGTLGGRAGSFALSGYGFPSPRRSADDRSHDTRRPGDESSAARAAQLIDRCQHVAMGCCVNLADFCRRCGIGDAFRRHKTLHFIGPDARCWDFSPSAWLPAPLHLVPAVMRLGYLDFSERLGILSAMRRLLKIAARSRFSRDVSASRTASSDEAAGAWLHRQGQSERAMELFWAIVLESASGEKLQRVSLAAAGQVFADGFLRSRQAYELLIPRAPLGELFDRRVGDALGRRGVAVHRRKRVARIDGDHRGAVSLRLSDSTCREFDAFVVAVPWYRVKALFSPQMAQALPFLDELETIPHAAITAVHLWHDRRITQSEHAVLPGRLAQWIFSPGNGYSQVVISAADELLSRCGEDICREIVAELQAAFPEAAAAELLDWRIVSQPRAVFALRPGVDALRPGQRTAIRNLALAGDWTDTRWPATMEGAVRSGYLAAEAIIASMSRRTAGQTRNQHKTAAGFLVEEAPASKLCRWLSGGRP